MQPASGLARATLSAAPAGERVPGPEAAFA